MNTENLRKYRGEKKSSGRRAIKRHRYPYKQHDLVLFNQKIYVVIGMQNKIAAYLLFLETLRKHDFHSL